jgi:N-acetylglucosamine kinase-like BadF-type ATPase
LSLTTVSVETVVHEIGRLVDALQPPYGCVSALSVGLAGATHAERAGLVASRLAERFGPARVEVVRDIDLVVWQLRSAGAALVVGTGVAVVAPTADGEVMVDGRGFGVGDRGGGAWIGLEALRLCLCQLDESGQRSPLLVALLAALGLPSDQNVAAAVSAGHGPDPARLARLAPVVLARAQCGDPNADQVVSGAVSAVTDSATWALRRARTEVPAVVVAAGGLTSSDLYWSRLQAALSATGAVGSIQRVDPVDGKPTCL